MTLAVGDWFVATQGEGPSVVLLHGTPSAPDDFSPIVAALATRYRVLVPHLPGYGRTPPCEVTLETTIVQLEERLLRDGVREAVLVGFSGGAYKAVALALRGHIQVSKLALLAPTLGLDAPVAQAYRDLVAAVRAGAFDPRPTWLERMSSPGFAARDPEGAARVMGWLDAVPTAVVCDELLALANAPDLRLRARELACPALVMSGTLDVSVPFAGSESLVASLPHGRLEAVEGVGHALFVEAKERVASALSAFLAAS